MAQLVKLLDYISRYESNPFHYPSQYIRLKQENWQKINEQWKNEEEQFLHQKEIYQTEDKKQANVRWNPFKKEVIVEEDQPFIRTLPRTKKGLTYHFVNQLYPLQLKWASSTVSHASFTKRNFDYNETLKYFLQRFPDIYLIMYYPIFNIKKAPIDGEIIMISPIGIDIITLVDKYPGATIAATNDRTWTIEREDSDEKIISPTITLKRTEQIVKSILHTHKIDFPIEKTVLSRNNQIVSSSDPYQTNIIDKNRHEDWFERKRQLKSSLKSKQLKAMEALLHHCQTTSVRRPEWGNEVDEMENPPQFEDL